jgi:hypothetical protein
MATFLFAKLETLFGRWQHLRRSTNGAWARTMHELDE